MRAFTLVQRRANRGDDLARVEVRLKIRPDRRGNKQFGIANVLRRRIAGKVARDPRIIFGLLQGSANFREGEQKIAKRRKGVERKVQVSGNLRGNNGQSLVNAAIDGLGVILQPTFLAYEALRRKQLVRILQDWEADHLTVFAVYPNRKFLPPKVRSFIDFLAERFGPEPYWDLDIKQKAHVLDS